MNDFPILGYENISHFFSKPSNPLPRLILPHFKKDLKIITEFLAKTIKSSFLIDVISL